jgi:hypothetical protein
MIYIVLNAAAIFAATLAGLAFGAIYFAVLRGGRTQPAGIRVTLAIAFVAEFWLCSILAGALILAPPKGGVWTMTLGSAFVIWLGFVVPALAASYRYRAIALRTTLVDCGHWLGVMLAQAAVLRLIGLVPPPV